RAGRRNPGCHVRGGGGANRPRHRSRHGAANRGGGTPPRPSMSHLRSAGHTRGRDSPHAARGRRGDHGGRRGGGGMKLVVFGLSLSSSWGNGHATTYRALLRAFAAREHEVVFYEWDAPWYGGAHRDLANPEFCRLELY